MEFITRNKVLLSGTFDELSLYLTMLGDAGLLVTNCRWINEDLYVTVQEVDVFPG